MLNCLFMTFKGQRYHIVVEANPIGKPEKNGNYWIRTDPAPGCNNFKSEVTKVTGIVRYDPLSTEDPDSEQNKYSRKCADETYSDLKPILKWTVPSIDFCKCPKLSIVIKIFLY